MTQNGTEVTFCAVLCVYYHSVPFCVFIIILCLFIDINLKIQTHSVPFCAVQCHSVPFCAFLMHA